MMQSMSDDLIKRSDAIEAIRNIVAQYIPFLNRVTESLPLNCEIALRSVPSADRPQGKWIITEQDNGHKWTHRKCSECGKGIIEPLGVSGMNYCPNCGARMKGADDETD